MADISEDLLRKIKQIQELAHRGGTIHEAEVAAGKLTELLLKHNLTLLDLDQVSDERGVKVGEQLFWLSTQSNWRRELLNQIARANGCRLIVFKGSKACRLIGYPHNMIVTIDMYQWLESIFDDIVEAERKKLRTREGWPALARFEDLDLFGMIGVEREIERLENSRRYMIQKPQSWSRAFRFGMVAGIAETMKAAKRKVELSDTKALVPLMEKEVDEYVESLGLKLRHTRVSLNASAREHGYHRGRQVNVSPQVGRGETNRAIGE